MELLVAMAIFAVVGTLALSGYTQLQRQSEYAQLRVERTREVLRAVQVLTRDVEQAEPRAIREPLGEAQLPAVAVAVAAEYTLQLTRAGWSNTAGLPRATLQRVGYRMDQHELWRDHWPVLDRTLSVEPTREKLLTGVKSMTFRVMDASGAWLDHWPETQAAAQAEARLRPVAIEITIELDDWGTIQRLVELPG
jgi:general secretion pathway protein J